MSLCLSLTKLLLAPLGHMSSLNTLLLFLSDNRITYLYSSVMNFSCLLLLESVRHKPLLVQALEPGRF